VRAVLDAARAAGLRIFFMRHMSLPTKLMGSFQIRMAMQWQGLDDPGQVRPWFLRDTPGFAIVPELARAEDEAILDKLTMSAFEGTPLAMALRDCGLLAFAIVRRRDRDRHRADGAPRRRSRPRPGGGGRCLRRRRGGGRQAQPREPRIRGRRGATDSAAFAAPWRATPEASRARQPRRPGARRLRSRGCRGTRSRPDAGLREPGIAGPGALVAPLEDSAGLLADPAALRRRLARDGYVYLRGVLPRDAVRAAREEVANRLFAMDELAAPPCAAIATGRSRRAVDGFDRGAFWESVSTGQHLRMLSHGPAIRAVMRAILDADRSLTSFSISARHRRAVRPGFTTTTRSSARRARRSSRRGSRSATCRRPTGRW
jgi:hypothetical protein